MQFGSGDIQVGAREVVNLEALHDLVLEVALTADGEAEPDARVDAVAAVGADGHGDHFAAAEGPGADVVGDGLGSGGGRGEAARLDDGLAALLNGGDEGLGDPHVATERGQHVAPARLGVRHVGILRVAVVAPDAHAVHVGHGQVELARDEGACAVGVELRERGDLAGWNITSGGNYEGVGVGGIAHHQHAHAGLGVLRERRALRAEDGRVSCQQVGACLPLAAWNRADENHDVGVMERLPHIRRLERAVQQRRREVLQFHDHAMEGGECTGQFEQLQSYLGVAAEYIARHEQW